MEERGEGTGFLRYRRPAPYQTPHLLARLILTRKGAGDTPHPDTEFDWSHPEVSVTSWG